MNFGVDTYFIGSFAFFYLLFPSLLVYFCLKVSQDELLVEEKMELNEIIISSAIIDRYFQR